MSSENKPPAEIRRACLILGLLPEELTAQAVVRAWKEQIAAPGVHPTDGGDTEAAIYLNTAKDTLIGWIEGDSGSNADEDGDPHQPSGVPRRPLPRTGSAAVAFPLPKLEDGSET